MLETVLSPHQQSTTQFSRLMQMKNGICENSCFECEAELIKTCLKSPNF